VFKPLLAVADLYPALVHGVLPLAMRAVEEVERERGSGTDSSLRYAGMVHQITWASVSSVFPQTVSPPDLILSYWYTSNSTL